MCPSAVGKKFPSYKSLKFALCLQHFWMYLINHSRPHLCEGRLTILVWVCELNRLYSKWVSKLLKVSRSRVDNANFTFFPIFFFRVCIVWDFFCPKWASFCRKKLKRHLDEQMSKFAAIAFKWSLRSRACLENALYDHYGYVRVRENKKKLELRSPPMRRL